MMRAKSSEGLNAGGRESIGHVELIKKVRGGFCVYCSFLPAEMKMGKLAGAVH